eukprot:scaffold1400_cov113-Isochrysis_galbana.AAC.1
MPNFLVCGARRGMGFGSLQGRVRCGAKACNPREESYIATGRVGAWDAIGRVRACSATGRVRACGATGRVRACGPSLARRLRSAAVETRVSA